MSTETLDAPTQTAEETTEESGNSNISGSELFARFRKPARTEEEEQPVTDQETEEPVSEEEDPTEQPETDEVLSQSDNKEVEEEQPEEEPAEGEEPPWFQKRWDRFVRKNNELKEQVAQLQQENDALKEGQGDKPGADILQITDPAELDKQMESAQSAIQLISQTLSNEPTEYDDNSNPVYELEGNKFTREQLLSIQENAFNVSKQIPSRKALIQQASQLNKQYEAAYPFFTDDTHDDYELAQKVQSSPEYKQLEQVTPHARELVVRYIESEYWRKEQEAKNAIKQKAKTTPKPRKAPKAATDTSTAAATLSDSEATQAAKKAIISKGNLSDRDLKRFFNTK